MIYCLALKATLPMICSPPSLVERPALAGFIGSLHENKIKRFVDLDKKLIMQNRQRLIQKLLQDRPSFYEGASPGSEIGILKGEFNRKRGHMPIRKLMSQAGNLIQKIKALFYDESVVNRPVSGP